MSRDWNSIMFDDIGKKLQKVAKAIAWFDIIASIIGGLVMFFYALTDLEYLFWLICLAPVVMVLGCIAAWLSVIVLYGLGVLIEDTHAIRKSNETTLKNIDVTLGLLARPAILEAEERKRQELNERFKRKAEDRATQEAQQNAQTAPAQIEHKIGERTWVCGKCQSKNLAVRNDCWSCGTPK